MACVSQKLDMLNEMVLCYSNVLLHSQLCEKFPQDDVIHLYLFEVVENSCCNIYNSLEWLWVVVAEGGFGGEKKEGWYITQFPQTQ